MSEHLSTQAIRRYRQRAMSPAELLAAGDHLAACAACRSSAAGAEALPAAFAALSDELHGEGAATDHLSYEQVAAYVDQGLSPAEREIAAAHVEACDWCAEEVRDLLAFRDTIPAQPAPQPEPARAPSRRERLAAFLRRPARLTLFRPAAAFALALLLLTAVSVLVMVSRRGGGRDDAVATSETPRTEVTPPARVEESPAPPDPGQATTGGGNPPVKLSTAGSPAPAGTASGAADGPVRGPELVASLNDAGGRVTLDRRGHVAGLSAVTAASERDLGSALRTGRAPTPAFIKELVGQTGALSGDTPQSTSFKLSSPVGTAVRQDRPTFEWQPLSGATAYTVTVSDSDLNPLVTSPPLPETRWTVPRPLDRGGVYVWQVSALREGREVIAPSPPAPEARFKVLGRAELEELQAAERAGSSSHLLRGVLYSRAGLLDEAEREFLALLQKNPHSPLARKLLRTLRQSRRPKDPAAR